MRFLTACCVVYGLLWVSAIGAGCAQQNHNTSDDREFFDSKVVCSCGNEYDFGLVQKGLNMYHAVEINNVGTDTLEFFEFDVSHPAIQMTVPGQIYPGDRAEISFQVDTSDIVGKYEFPIRFQLNSRTQPEWFLTVKIHIVEPDLVRPAVLNLGTVFISDPGSKVEQITLFHDKEVQYSVIGMDTSQAFAKVEYVALDSPKHPDLPQSLNGAPTPSMSTSYSVTWEIKAHSALQDWLDKHLSGEDPTPKGTTQKTEISQRRVQKNWLKSHTNVLQTGTLRIHTTHPFHRLILVPYRFRLFF